MIVPVGKIPACLSCQRVSYPTVPGSDKSILPPDWPGLPSRREIGQGIRRLTSHPGKDQNGVWSPDGETIAFVSDRSGDSQIWLMDKEGGTGSRLSFESSIEGQTDLLAAPVPSSG
jgi:dipeptidyl aminopeptidase/acylaminoacyl peptidase